MRRRKKRRNQLHHQPQLNQAINLNITTFEPDIKHILTKTLSTKNKTNDIRLMLISQDYFDYEIFKQVELRLVYSMTQCTVIGTLTKLQAL